MTPREKVLRAWRDASARVDLAGRVAAALAGDDRPIVVVAAGKCARAMLEGALRVRGGALIEALAVVPAGSAWAPGDPRVRVLEAAHPLPDELSVRAAEAALALAASASDANRLFLISGGTSSLLCAPAPGLSLSRKREVVRAMLEADAPIAEVNVVRRHLSRIKGGGLARACGARARRTLIVSDVLEGGPEDVGSGPSVADPTSVTDAERVAARLGLGDDLPWIETWKDHERCDVLADPPLFGELVREGLAREGFQARTAAPARDLSALADDYAHAADAMRPGEALVRMAEPTLRVDPAARGRGGRSSHLAAMMATRIPPRTLFAAIATDGVDGSSGTGGAVVEGPIAGAEAALERFDTGPLHLAAGTALPRAPTGLNFADLHVLVRY
ncbi:MAG TPA: DUF4147 domain-containing protein [Polyangiaceae bacterium]|nr:DUF4147 domain-containing protein [Polyangiaceae bacterium]